MSKKEEKEIAPEKFFEQRTEQIVEATKKGINVYPHKFEVKNTFEQIFEVAEKYENDNRSTEEMQAAGRISTIRDHSKFSFYTVVYNDETLQLVFSKDTEKKQETAAFLRRGDQIGFRGFPGKTRTGEKSLFL